MGSFMLAECKCLSNYIKFTLKPPHRVRLAKQKSEPTCAHKREQSDEERDEKTESNIPLFMNNSALELFQFLSFATTLSRIHI